jgi:hypothetical protein
VHVGAWLGHQKVRHEGEVDEIDGPVVAGPWGRGLCGRGGGT